MWSSESSDYAVREVGGRIKVFKNFAERSTIALDYVVEGLHGGALIGALLPLCL